MQSADAQSKGVQTQTTALIETVAQGQKTIQIISSALDNNTKAVETQGQKTIQIISSALDNNTKAVEALTGQLSIQNAEMIAIRTLLIAEIRQTKEEAVEEIVERITEIVEAKNDISSYESGSGSDVSSV